TIHAPDGQLGAGFGLAVAAAGDGDGDGLRGLIVGEPLRHTPAGVGQGRVSGDRGTPADPDVEGVPTPTFAAPQLTGSRHQCQADLRAVAGYDPVGVVSSHGVQPWVPN